MIFFGFDLIYKDTSQVEVGSPPEGTCNTGGTCIYTGKNDANFAGLPDFQPWKLAVSLSDGDLLIGPCRLQRPRTMTRDETGQGGPGTKGIIREEEPGPGTCSVNAKVLNPFSRKGM